MRLVVLLSASLTLLPALAAAEPRDGDCALARRAGKPCVLDLPAEEVTGDKASADDVATRILVFATERSLIRVRHDFLPEIVKAAEDL
jgi:hypothetical protein